MRRTSIVSTGLANPWLAVAQALDYRKLPAGPSAILAALHLTDPRYEALARLDDAQWLEALAFSDKWQLTLSLRRVAGEFLPAWVRERMDENAAHNRERHRRLEVLYRRIAGALEGIEFVALKGLAHCRDFGSLPEDRTQCDVDLYIPGDLVYAARDAILALGYESMKEMEPFPTDHLPTLILKSGWQWRGDHFDPDIPLGIELHFQFWNDRVERLPVPDAAGFWTRRVTRTIAGTHFSVLCEMDALAYASLHLLKHVLQGSVRPFHVYEVARFLDSRADSPAFWRQWRVEHSPELRRLEAVIFRLATAWFGGAANSAVDEEIAQLPAATRAWFDEFALSPASGLFRSNKDELWLHLSLLKSRRDAWSVTKRRLLPERLPGPVDAVYIPDSQMRWSRRMLKRLRWARHVTSRLRHHSAALPRLLLSGVRWRRAC